MPRASRLATTLPRGPGSGSWSSVAGDWPGLLTRVQTQMQPLGPTSWGDRRFLGSVLACPVPHLHVKGLVFIMGARKDIRIDKIPDLDFQPGRCALQRAFQPCPPPIPTAPLPQVQTHPPSRIHLCDLFGLFKAEASAAFQDTASAVLLQTGGPGVFPASWPRVREPA